MHLITSESSFDASHFLTNYEGKCKNIHGHRWRVVVTIKGELTNGMLVDFGDFKKDIKDLCDYFDHSFIVEKGSLDKKLFNLLNKQFVLRVVEFRTTAENFSKYIFEEMSKKYSVKEVCVYETPNNCARYVCE